MTRPRHAAPARPTVVCIECDGLIRLGTWELSHGVCDDCAPDFLARYAPANTNPEVTG